MTKRLTAVAATTVVLVLLASGCNDDNTDAARSSTPSASTSPSSDVPTSPPSTLAASPPTTSPPTSAATTTSEPTPTTLAAITVAPTTQPGSTENWVAIVQGLENIRTTLYEAPDPARASEMCAVNSTCEEQLHAQFTDMVNKGYRVVDSPPMEVVSADVVPNSYEGASIAESIVVSVDVVFRIPDDAAGRVVDAAGTTVFNLEYTPPPGQTYMTRMTLLRDGPSGPWRESLQEMEQ